MSSQEILSANAQAELQRFADRVEAGAAVAARHLQTGATLLYKNDASFPMASCVKVPLAVAIFHKAERGELGLTDMVAVRPEEMAPRGVLGAEFPHDGIALSVLNHMEIMITHSDSTSTDVLFRLCGGPEGVARIIRAMGIEDFEISRSMRTAHCVLHEIPLPPENISIREALADQPEEVLNARERPHDKHADFHHDQRDHCTPEAMLAVLELIWDARLITPASRDILLGMMSRCQHSDKRIRARLPEGTPTATKGGSGAGTAVDVGYVTLPGDRGTVAVAYFVKASPQTMDRREEAIADMSRFVFDYFVLTTSSGAGPA